MLHYLSFEELLVLSIEAGWKKFKVEVGIHRVHVLANGRLRRSKRL